MEKWLDKDKNSKYNISELISKYNPILYFHPDENYFPCSIEWLLNNSILVDFNTTPQTMINSPSNRDMYEVSKKYNFKSNTSGQQTLSFTQELYNGQIPIKNVPCYVLVKKRENKIYLIYNYLYAYNGNYDILGLEKVGNHPADLEHITVELDDSGKLLRVMYSAHGERDGRWVDAKNVPFEDNRIIAYVALNGHGLYQREGTAIRVFGLANDVMKRGKKWDPVPERIYLPTEPEFDIDKMGWVGYNGRLGGTTERGDTSGISCLLDKNYIRNIDILNQKQLKSPIIIDASFSSFIKTTRNVLLFVLFYFIIYGLLIFIRSLLKIECCGFSFVSHLLTIIIVVLTAKIVTSGLSSLINYFSPT